MLDGVLSSFFVATTDYAALDEVIKTILTEEYFVTAETVVASTCSKKFWSNIWDELQPCTITLMGLVPNESFTFDAALSYTVLRPKALLQEVFDEQQIIMRSMASPLITIHFYNDSNPVALDGRHSTIDRAVPKGYAVTTKIVTYALEDLEPIQLDYVNELFTVVWQEVYDEQKEAYDEEQLSRGRPPVNSLIGQFVTAMTFERHEDDCYLTFTYEVYNKAVNPNVKKLSAAEGEVPVMVLDKEAELPTEIEIMASIPLADDDDAEIGPADMESVTVDEDGDYSINFAITASRK